MADFRNGLPENKAQISVWNEFIGSLSSNDNTQLNYTCALSVQSLSRVWLCDAMNCSMPGVPVHHQLLEPTQIHVHWVGDATQPSHPLSSPFPPGLNLSQHQGLIPTHRLFAIRWPKYWSFSCNISPSNEYPGLIFRMDWLDLLAVQGTLESPPTLQF